MYQSDLDGLVRRWVPILRLQDWEITVVLVRRHELDDHETFGNCDVCQKNKSALIYIGEPKDYREADVELTLVHELLHIHLDLWKVTEDSIEDDMREQAVVSISNALLKLYRGREEG